MAAISLPSAAGAVGSNRPDTGSLTVVQEVVPWGNEGEDVTGSVPVGEGRRFDADTTATGVEGLPGSRTTTGDGTGSVHFGLAYAQGTDTAPITVTGDPGSASGVVTQDGADAVCADRSAREGRLPVTDDGSVPGRPGFTVEVPAGASVTCTVYQRQEAADVRVDRLWIVDGEDLAPEALPDGLDARLTLTGPGGAGATVQDWGVARGGYGAGDTVTIDESVLIGHEGCVLTDARLSEADGEAVDEPLPADVTLTGQGDAYTVTNSVACHDAEPETQLTLAKGVENDSGGTAEPTDWTLSADGGTQVSGASGRAEVTDAVVAPGDYVLSESGGPDGYEAADWICRRSDGQDVAVDGATVSLAKGTRTICVIIADDVSPPEPLEAPEPSESPGADEPSKAPEPPEPSESLGTDQPPEVPEPSGLPAPSAPERPSHLTPPVEPVVESPSGPSPSPSGPSPSPSGPSPSSGRPGASDLGAGGLGTPDIGGGGHSGDADQDRRRRPLALTGPSVGFGISGALLLTGLGMTALLIARERRQARSRRTGTRS